MSLSVTKGQGVTVFTVNSDTGNACPLVRQLLGALCCTPACYVPGRLRKLTVGPLSSLATVQIMMGLLTIGFGAVLMSLYDGPYFMWYINAPYWLGYSFIISGLFSIFGEWSCLVSLTGVVNVASAVFAAIAIVFYSVDEGPVFDRSCLVSRQNGGYYSRYAGSYGDYRRVKLTDVERNMKDSNLQICQMYKNAVLPIAKGLKVLLVASAALQLCVSISVAVLAIKALKKNSEGEVKKSTGHVVPSAYCFMSVCILYSVYLFFLMYYCQTRF